MNKTGRISALALIIFLWTGGLGLLMPSGDSHFAEVVDGYLGGMEIPRVNMELQIPQVEACPGETVDFQVVTRINPGEPLMICDLENNWGALLNSINYSFTYVINDTDSIWEPNSPGLIVTPSYLTNNTSPATAYNMGPYTEIYFDDENWTCSTGSDCELFYTVQGGGTAYIGECDDTDPPRAGAQPLDGEWPNWTHRVIFHIPSTLTGPATIDFSSASEFGIMYMLQGGMTLPFGIPFPAQAEGMIEGCDGETCPPQINVYAADDPDCNPLPLHLIRFDAESAAGGNIVRWEYLKRSENAELVLLRSNGKDPFAEIARYDVQDHGIGRLTDEHLDPRPFRGHNYYRLLMVDIDGEQSYSNLAYAHFDASVFTEWEVSIYPNPFSEVLTISGLPDQAGHFRLLDQTGKTVSQFILSGEENARLHLEFLPSGLYYAVLRLGERTETYSLVKK